MFFCVPGKSQQSAFPQYKCIFNRIPEFPCTRQASPSCNHRLYVVYSITIEALELIRSGDYSVASDVFNPFFPSPIDNRFVMTLAIRYKGREQVGRFPCTRLAPAQFRPQVVDYAGLGIDRQRGLVNNAELRPGTGVKKS